MDLLNWRIVLRGHVDGRLPDPPAGIVTTAARIPSDAMPAEVGILLPASEGPGDLINAVTAAKPGVENHAVGLFMASPFLNLNRESRRLNEAGVTWVANLPSVSQQDEEFSAQLTDVQLDYQRELDTLAEMQRLGYRIVTVVSDESDARRAMTLGAEIMVIMPRIQDFAAGFPSPRQRDSAARAITAIAKNGSAPIVVGLGDDEESQNERRWSRHVDGLICRPRPHHPERPNF